MLNKFYSILIYCFILTACTDESDESYGNLDLGYTGSREPAIITEENVNDILHKYSVALHSAIKIQTIAFRGRANKPTNNSNTNINSRVRVGETYTEICTDTGSLGTEKITGTTEIFRFSLNYDYKGFCLEDTEYNGNFHVEGIYFSKINYQFNEYNYKSVTQSITINGTANLIQKEQDESPKTTTEGGRNLSIRVKDNVANIDYLIDHYSYRYNSQYYFSNGSENTYTINFSGRIYHSELGYIDIESTKQFERNGGSKYFQVGEMTFLGKNNVKMVITALNTNNYRIEIDTDNDGSFESSESKPWENIASDEITFMTFFSPYYY